jgi:Family of unknown function (DUF6049)
VGKREYPGAAQTPLRTRPVKGTAPGGQRPQPARSPATPALFSGNGNNISGVPRLRAVPGSLIRATVTVALLAAVIAVAGGCLLATAPAAHAGETRRLAPLSSASVAINSVSPQVARPGGTVTVSGTVTNKSRRTLSGLSIQLRSSAAQLNARDDLTSYANGTLDADTPVGTPVLVTEGLSSGATAQWRVSLPVTAIGISAFGVYPLAAQAVDAVGLPVGTARTFLPFWPGGAASGLSQRLKVAWVWPLLNAPLQGICPQLTSNSLAGSIAPGGRLGTLLATGSAYAASAGLTWAVDPGLLQSAATMTHPYRVGGTAACSGGTIHRASPAAAQWLSAVRAASSSQQMFTTPYDDVDVAALSHQGLDSGLTSAYHQSQVAASSLLGTSSATGSSAGRGAASAMSGSIAWPADGLADSSVLANLAVNGISTVVLSSDEMPAPSGTFIPDDAVASTPTATGTTMKVLLADSAITGVLGSATSAPGSSFAVSQRFLAETAMIAAESPGLARSVVVAPPREWDPSAALAGQLLSESETASAPWLAPGTLAALASSPVSTVQAGRLPPPDNHVSLGELNGFYLKQVGALDSQVRVYKSILFQPKAPYLSQLNEGVAATESSAWRGSAAAGAAGVTMLDRVTDYLTGAFRKVQIVNSARATLVGSSGTLPVSIVNGLPQSIQVRLEATVPPDGRLTVTGETPPGLITVGAGQTVTARLSVRSTAIGDTTIGLRLLGKDGKPLPSAPVSLSVQSTQFGSTLLVIIYVALGVFVLTAIARAIRRALRDDPPRRPQGGQPGGPGHGNEAERPEGAPTMVDGAATVESDNEGTAPRHPPEAPDDFADVRGSAGYT